MDKEIACLELAWLNSIRSDGFVDLKAIKNMTYWINGGCFPCWYRVEYKLSCEDFDLIYWWSSHSTIVLCKLWKWELCKIIRYCLSNRTWSCYRRNLDNLFLSVNETEERPECWCNAKKLKLNREKTQKWIIMIHANIQNSNSVKLLGMHIELVQAY